ncbi:MAG: AtzE family amidohydrolase [Gammaproteobacteria bacterium]
MNPASASALEIAARVRRGELSAEALTRAALDRVETLNPSLNCFTTLLSRNAIESARIVDSRVGNGEDPGPLAGVPVGVKDLFDVEGVVTLAGSKILADNPPAATDAVLLRRLRRAGAVLIGCQNMDEFAYGFTTENAHYGATHNPHDATRVAGGSSGGSAASVAAGLVAISLGSDTNGSIRVPSSYCGVFGLKPTFGRLPRTGTFPFVHDLDHLGPFARSATDVALAYDVIQGHDPGDPACTQRPAEYASAATQMDVGGLNAGVLGGWFEEGASDDALDAVRRVAEALGPVTKVLLPEAKRARAAAFCITCATGAALHYERLKSRPHDFDPATRDRFFAGTMLPATVLARAQRFRRWFAEAAAALFRKFDVLLAPSTPDVAPLIGQKTMKLRGVDVPTRPNIGIYTQPISFIGLPVAAVPLWTARGLPIGVQIIGPPWEEARVLRVAAYLERAGVVSSKKPSA